MNTPRQKKILLVYPEVPNNTYWSFSYALHFIGKKSSMPPLGLITVAAMFPDAYDLKLVDMNIEPLDPSDIMWADAVFISAMIVQKDSLAGVIRLCNQHEKPVVAGGPYPTSSWQDISGVDHFVLGEVENIFDEFLRDFENGTAQKIYRNPSKPDISRAVRPRFELLKMDAYGSMALQYSRGCPFKCEFCDIWKSYGNKPRLKSSESVICELERLYQLGWQGAVFIVDDNFIGNKRRLKRELLPLLKDWQAGHAFPFRFFTEASINLADDVELMEGMRDAGFNEVFIGIETPSVESLKETGKYQNLKTDLCQAVKTIQRYGMEVMAGFILGFDSDTDDIFDRQIAFIEQAGIPKAMVGLMTALPGTDLHQRLQAEGRILSESTGNNTHAMGTNFMTRMDQDKLLDGYQYVLASIYDANLKNYFKRCSDFMDNLVASPHFERKIGVNEIIMLLKSLILQPFKPYGLQYLKFVARNTVRNRHIFGEVIKFCIVGHHFHTITQETLKIVAVTADLEAGYQTLKDQLSRYSTQIVGNSKDALQYLGSIWQQRKRILENAKIKIDGIHVDFRDEILTQYSEISHKMISLFKNFEKELTRIGIKL